MRRCGRIEHGGARSLLRREDDRPALVFWNEGGRQGELSYAELHDQVSRLALALSRQGVTTAAEM